MLKTILTNFFLIFLVATVYSQPRGGLVVHYTFDNCDAVDVIGNNSDGIIRGEPNCACGVADGGLELNGIDDQILLSGNIESYFRDDQATYSFYIRATELGGTYDILSKLESCDADRGLAFRYAPSSRTVSIFMAESADKKVEFNYRIEEQVCWIHVAVVKAVSASRLFINGELVAETSYEGNLDIENNAPLFISGSPCLGQTDQFLAGVIDDIRIYNRILDPFEIEELYFFPDRIATPDTVIFEGGEVDIRLGNTCTNSFQWESSIDILDESNPETRIVPTATNTYFLNFEYQNCTAQDSILIDVVNPEEIECGQLPLPNAFTPNQDGRNDEFFISNPFAVDQLISFRILDKWGNVMFETSNISEAWDGTYLGKEVNPGVYMYQVEYTCQNQEQFVSGSVMVIK